MTAYVVFAFVIFVVGFVAAIGYVAIVGWPEKHYYAPSKSWFEDWDETDAKRLRVILALTAMAPVWPVIFVLAGWHLYGGVKRLAFYKDDSE